MINRKTIGETITKKKIRGVATEERIVATKEEDSMKEMITEKILIMTGPDLKKEAISVKGKADTTIGIKKAMMNGESQKNEEILATGRDSMTEIKKAMMVTGNLKKEAIMGREKDTMIAKKRVMIIGAAKRILMMIGVAKRNLTTIGAAKKILMMIGAANRKAISAKERNSKIEIKNSLIARKNSRFTEMMQLRLDQLGLKNEWKSGLAKLESLLTTSTRMISTCRRTIKKKNSQL